MSVRLPHLHMHYSKWLFFTQSDSRMVSRLGSCLPTLSLSLQIICISRIGQQIAQTCMCLLGGASGMGTHGCECYLLAFISGSNFHLVCISGKIREVEDLGSSTTVMKVHRPKYTDQRTSSFFGNCNRHG